MFTALITAKIDHYTTYIIAMSGVLLFALPVYISLFLDEKRIRKSLKNKYCICPHCGAKFKITLLNYFRRFDSKYLLYVSCPKCKKRSHCAPLPIKEDEKDEILGPSKKQKIGFIISVSVLIILLILVFIFYAKVTYEKLSQQFYI